MHFLMSCFTLGDVYLLAEDLRDASLQEGIYAQLPNAVATPMPASMRGRQLPALPPAPPSQQDTASAPAKEKQQKKKDKAKGKDQVEVRSKGKMSDARLAW
eukprot:m.288455 g.288455  ORF g.288455 m.288455 type:complete len:101 (-) comp15803_c1_seq2:259-561(-)